MFENIRKGLESLGNSLVENAKDKHKWDEESRSLGLISTTDKVRWLEAEAYRKIRVDKDITQELKLIESLRDNQKLDLIKLQANDDSFSLFILDCLKAIIFATAFSLVVIIPTQKHCIQNNLQSNYCQEVREQVKYFTGK